MTTVVKKTDSVVVPVTAFLDKIYRHIKEVSMFVIRFLKSVFSICVEVLYTPFKLFGLWNTGYSIKPIVVLNGLKTKTKRQRLGGGAFAYNFETKLSKYKIYIYYDFFQGGFVVGKPINFMSAFRNYNDYKTCFPVDVVKTYYPTLKELRKAYKIAINLSKVVIKEDTRIERVSDFVKELGDVEMGKDVVVIGFGDPRNATEFTFKKTERGFVSISSGNYWFKTPDVTTKELAERMVKEYFRIYKI